jgi:hypothetical protein
VREKAEEHHNVISQSLVLEPEAWVPFNDALSVATNIHILS